MQVVVHRPGTTTARLWVQAEVVERGWTLAVVGDDGSRTTQDPLARTPDHLLVNVAPRTTDTRIWWVDVDDLSPGRHYAVHYVGEAGEDRPIAEFATLPADLDHGPFRLLLASCYSEDRDLPLGAGSDVLARREPGLLTRLVQAVAQVVRRSYVALQSLARTGPPPAEPVGNVSKRYEAVHRSDDRPHVKFLVGDQVYLDAPYQDFLFPIMSETRMKRHISRTYSRSWEKLNWFLAHTGNYFTSDDHEFWNNYPFDPVWWPVLKFGGARDRWRLHAADFLRAVQDPQGVATFDIGTDERQLAFCLADTRKDRTVLDDPAPRFLAEADLQRVLTWVRGLDCPGVLVVGQPLLAAEGNALKDYNLPAYRRQYEALCGALAEARHDVLVLTGDIHYTRRAEITLDASPTRLYELVSSPLAVLVTAPGRYPESFDDGMKEFPTVSSDGTRYGTVTYSNPLPDYEGICPDHFMVLSFSRAGGEITVEPRIYLMREQDTGPVPVAPITLR